MSDHHPDFLNNFDYNFANLAASDPVAGISQHETPPCVDPRLLLYDQQQGGASTEQSGTGANSQPLPEFSPDVDWSWLNDMPGHEGDQNVAAAPADLSQAERHPTIVARPSHSPNVNPQVDRSYVGNDLISQSIQRAAMNTRSPVAQDGSPNMPYWPDQDRAPEQHFSPTPWSNEVPALRTPQMQQTWAAAHNMTQNNPYGSPIRSIEEEHQQYGLHQQRFTQRQNHGHQHFQQANVALNIQQSPGILHQYSPDPEETPDPEYRPKSKGKARDTSTPHEKPRCLDCGKRYRLTKSEGRCSRCADKHIRRLAGQTPHTYILDPSVPDIATARQIVSPMIPGRNLSNDDYHRYGGQEDMWVERLLQAVNVVQSEATEGSSVWALRQQTYLNEKASLEKGYTDTHVTARLRALYQEIVNYHSGGPAVYAIGGDNAGYTDNRILSFSKRINLICEIMARNKRVVMDVVEGRGVQGLVANPEVYNRRKQSNNNCNEEKKRIMEKGKEVEGVTPGPKTRKRRRTAASPEPDFDAHEPVAGPSGVRRSPRLAEQLESAIADLDGAGQDELGDDDYIPPQGYSAYGGYK